MNWGVHFGFRHIPRPMTQRLLSFAPLYVSSIPTKIIFSLNRESEIFSIINFLYSLLF